MPPVPPCEPQYQQPYQQPHYAAGDNPMSMGVPPKNWLVESILCTLCCCLPFGIVGIVKASNVNSLWNAGRYDEAYKASADAKKWTFYTIVMFATEFINNLQ